MEADRNGAQGKAGITFNDISANKEKIIANWPCIDIN